MKVYIDDKGRYLANTGYGNLSRQYGISLARNGVKVVYPQFPQSAWSARIASRVKDEFERSVEYGYWADCDVALTISPPCLREIQNIPNVLYTQNALGALIPIWGEYVNGYDNVIVPGEFDVTPFRKYISSVDQCPQLVDSKLFCARPKWREEGGEKFSFIFVGSLSYRKGVDLLLEAFCKFSLIDGNESKLVLVCPGATNINYLLRLLRQYNPAADVELMIEETSQEWVCRYINRSDVFVTLSRGEGWCMPLFESVLAEKPCIVPNSTAMGECSPNRGSIYKLPVREAEISGIKSEFGEAFRKKYCKDGGFSYDVQVDDAIKAFSEMKLNHKKARLDVTLARDEVLKRYSPEVVGGKLREILEKTAR